MVRQQHMQKDGESDEAPTTVITMAIRTFATNFRMIESAIDRARFT
jgi:hypothetical protein